MSDFTPTPTNLDEVVLAAEYSQTNVEYRGVTCTPSGYFYAAGKRISLDRAIELIAEPAPAPEAEPAPAPRQPKRTGFAWDSLNQATQDLFFGLCEAILEQTRDHDLSTPVRLGHDIAKVPLVDAPRLTSLKKAGLVETVAGEVKSYRYLRLTDAGRARWTTTTGS